MTFYRVLEAALFLGLCITFNLILGEAALAYFDAPTDDYTIAALVVFCIALVGALLAGGLFVTALGRFIRRR